MFGVTFDCMKLRSVLLLAAGIAIGAFIGYFAGSRAKAPAVVCTPGLRNLEAAMQQMRAEAASNTPVASPATTAPTTNDSKSGL